jgi:hypothetical protein
MPTMPPGESAEEALLRGSHVPVVGLAQFVRPFFTFLPLLLRSVVPSTHLFSFPALVFQLVALWWILRYPKQFLELLGLFIAHFREPTSL